MRSVLILFSMSILFIQCNSSNSIETSPIIGQWKMKQVFEEDQDVSSQHNPKNDRWIQFKADHTFLSDGSPYGRNTGKWSINDSELFLDSDAGEGDDSYWIVDIEGQSMKWKGTRSDFTEKFSISHEKIVEGTENH